MHAHSLPIAFITKRTLAEAFSLWFARTCALQATARKSLAVEGAEGYSRRTGRTRGWSMRSIGRRTLLLFALVVSGCANSSVQKIGTANYAPLPQDSEVLVYTDESQIKGSFEVVGFISYTNPGKYQVLTVGDAIEPLKVKAREVGGNGIIIGQSQAIKSGLISTGVTVTARAIRVSSAR